MASKKSVNLSIHDKVLQEAEAVMTLRGMTSLSVLVEELLRGEYEKRFGPVISTTALADKIEDAALAEIGQPHEAQLHDAPTPPPKPPAPHAKGRSTKASVRSQRKP